VDRKQSKPPKLLYLINNKKLNGALSKISLEQVDQLELVEKLLEWELQLKSDPDIVRHLRMLDANANTAPISPAPAKPRGPRP
jgi:hypothetical protein